MASSTVVTQRTTKGIVGAEHKAVGSYCVECGAKRGRMVRTRVEVQTAAQIMGEVVFGIAASHIDETLREIGDGAAQVGHDDVECRHPVEHSRHDESGNTEAAAHDRARGCRRSSNP